MLVPTPFCQLFSTEIFESLIKQGSSQGHGFICKEVAVGWLAGACFCRTEGAKESSVQWIETNGRKLISGQWPILLNCAKVL